MKLAIIGPAFSGKTTVFNALTGAAEPLSDFSGGGPEHRREVAVPDPRLERLTKDYDPKKVTPARMEFVDLAAYGGDKYFGEVRQQEALVRVVRAFKGEAVPHPKERAITAESWKKDVEDLDTDFVVQDLTMVERRIDKLEKSSKKPSKTQKEELEELALFQRIRPGLEEGVPLKKGLPADDQKKLQVYGFLTLKPILTLVNMDDDADPAALGLPPVPADVGSGPVDEVTIPIKARLEAEVAQLDEADKRSFLADFGLDEPIRDRVIRLSYALLGLQSFLTAGPKEVRAWTIPKGATAVEAAKVIHSDIARGFIRAEVVSWSDYEACGGWKAAKDQNKLRLEGKAYVMQDGEVVEFRHGG
ncbi:MAG: YchF family ATPase [Planctomycetes bacterium]|nr:YchF family ATPase [Planctomycetota bacterium]